MFDPIPDRCDKACYDCGSVIDALASYTGCGFNNINKFLRGKVDGYTEAPWLSNANYWRCVCRRIALIDSLFHASDLTSRWTPFYRSVSLNVLNPSTLAGVLEDSAFVSVSESRDFVASWDDVILEIAVPPGTPTINVNAILGKHGHEDEKEHLLPPGTKFDLMKTGASRWCGTAVIPEHYSIG